MRPDGRAALVAAFDDFADGRSIDLSLTSIDMAGFVFKLLGPPGMSPTNMTDEQREIMGRHASYWQGLSEAGHAVAYGPVDDGASGYGIGIVRADDADHARALADGDPALTAEAGFRTEISPMLALVTPAGRE